MTSDGAQTASTNEIQKASYDETWQASDANRPQTDAAQDLPSQSQGTASPYPTTDASSSQGAEDACTPHLHSRSIAN